MSCFVLCAVFFKMCTWIPQRRNWLTDSATQLFSHGRSPILGSNLSSQPVDSCVPDLRPVHSIGLKKKRFLRHILKIESVWMSYSVVFNVSRGSGTFVTSVEIVGRVRDGRIVLRACVETGTSSCGSSRRPVSGHVIQNHVTVDP